MAKKTTKRGEIPRPKEDIKIDKKEPKFNAALSALVNKPKKKDDESTS
jgi:hypothetical protein